MQIENKSIQVNSCQVPSTTAGFRKTFDRLPFLVVTLREILTAWLLGGGFQHTCMVKQMYGVST